MISVESYSQTLVTTRVTVWYHIDICLIKAVLIIVMVLFKICMKGQKKHKKID